MPPFRGFIQDQLEIKLLILYIAARLVDSAPFEVIQDLAMCDEGVDYFSFSQCMADLVRTQHLTLSKGRYTITDKGRDNSAACEDSLPYSVRLLVDKNIVAHNQRLLREALIGAEVVSRPSGGYTVTLSLNDKRENVMRLELLVAKESMARDLQERFRRDAEELYSKIIDVLYGK